jgi:hypothetical protein
MTSSVRESFVNLRKHGMSSDYQYQQTPTAMDGQTPREPLYKLSWAKNDFMFLQMAPLIF